MYISISRTSDLAGHHCKQGSRGPHRFPSVLHCQGLLKTEWPGRELISEWRFRFAREKRQTSIRLKKTSHRRHDERKTEARVAGERSLPQRAGHEGKPIEARWT